MRWAEIYEKNREIKIVEINMFQIINLIIETKFVDITSWKKRNWHVNLIENQLGAYFKC
jgi:hypothetical protein